MTYKTPTEFTAGKPVLRVTMAEINALIGDDGYSGNARQTRLKQILAQISSNTADDPEAAQLRETVKSLIEHYQDDEPIAKDTL